MGVEYLPSPRTQEEEVITARARKLVVVAAGALGSPCILERSGIGGSALLGRMSVDVEVDLPGVGENHQGAWRWFCVVLCTGVERERCA